MKKIALAAAALAVFTTAPAAASEQRAIVVETADLDLTDSNDIARLDIRIDSAIRNECRTGGRSVSDFTAERECRENLRAAADNVVRIAVAQAREGRLALLNLNPGA